MFPSTLASGASAYYVMCVAWLKNFLAKILDFLLWKLWQFVVVAGHNSHDFFKLPIYSQRPPKSILSSAPKKRNQWISQQNRLLGPKAATDHLDLWPQHYESHTFYKIPFAFKITQNKVALGCIDFLKTQKFPKTQNFQNTQHFQNTQTFQESRNFQK